MRALSTSSEIGTTKIDRTGVRPSEQLFGSCVADVAKTLWPEATAAFVATAAGCSQRAAEYYLGGQREWSGDAIAAIVSEILKRHSMRNVRIRARP